MTNQCVQVKLELGHKASVRKKPTIEGFTHDWTVFVRGPEGSNIQHFVDKVIFYLHESFPKPKRAIKEPPYQVSESGYAGFLLPIEVYFKNKEEPKKVRFDYDLFLHLEGCPPVNHIRCEKLTFQNPTEDFRRKLIKAGGVPIPPNEVPTYPPPVAGSTEPQSFVDIFGTPHKTSKSSPEPSKKFKSAKDGKSGTSKGPKSTLSTTSSSSTIPSKEPKSSSSKDKEHKTSTREMKTAIKRPPSPTSIPPETSTQKTLKRSLSTSSSTSIGSDSLVSAQAKKDKKNKDRDKHKKEKSHKNKKQDSDNRKIENEMTKPHKKSTPLATTQPSVTNKAEPSSGLTGPTRSELLLLENMRSDDEMQERENQDPADTSPSSSISFSSLPVVGVGGALGTLMAELDDQDDDDDFISPIPSEKSPPNLFPMSIPKPPEIVKPSVSPSQPLKTVTSEKQEKKPEKKHKRTSSTSSKKSSKADKKSNSNLENNPNGQNQQNQQINNEYIAELLDLQRRIMALKDRHHLQQIVNVIEETGLFQVTNTTFDFDLCSLDKNTVRKLQGCLQASA